MPNKVNLRRVFFTVRSAFTFVSQALFIHFSHLSHLLHLSCVYHILSILVVHNTLVLTMYHFFWSPLTLQDTSYSPEPHISAERSQSLLSAQEAVSLWVLGTRKVCILTRLLRDDATLIHFLSPIK